MPRATKPFSLIAPAPLGSSTWLLHLRSIAITGQLVTIIAASFSTRVSLPLRSLLTLVTLTVVTNVVLRLMAVLS